MRIATLTNSQVSELACQIDNQAVLLSKSSSQAKKYIAATGSRFQPSTRDLAELASVVERNVQRRAIRLPWLFSKPVQALYKRIKLKQAQTQLIYFATEMQQQNATHALIWNGSLAPFGIIALAAKALGLPCTFVENGYFPGTIQVDNQGINANNSMPQHAAFYQRLAIDWQSLAWPEKLNKRASKNKAGTSNIPFTAKQYIFVPMQVPSDMQVMELSPWIKSMAAFYNVLLRAATELPNINFVIKEHPSFKRSIQRNVTKHPQIVFANQGDTEQLIENASAVITLNSTVGLEALAKNIPVIQLGLSCYGITGLVHKCENSDALIELLQHKETLNQINHDLLSQYIKYLYNIFLLRHNDSLAEQVKARMLGTDKHNIFLEN
ncbi:capsular polysaccharide export protein, LipB/KpsS family [Salinibius halmophilus]|uniref:capsular polysaccharide export protein, LipB/KpsS family n=1 Tax=Salinibius halmophilus TaxID=1853216 RepID=UPI000E669FA7|nr:nitrogen fixation protein FixF [Salinibius halmophilus]